jgi:hypothetical protein
MKFFWPIYLLTAVASTAVVYVAAPLARPQAKPAVDKPGAASPATQESAPPAETELRTVAPLPPATTEPGAATASADEDAYDFAPAVLGISLATRHDKPAWGISAQRTTTYGLDGSRLGHVPGGTLLEYRAARVASIGNMVECVLLENDKPSAPCLVGKKDVQLFTGSYAKLSAKRRTALQAYYALNGKISQRKIELLQAAASKNPYFAEYNQAYKKYMAHIEAAKVLNTKRDKATELDKSRIEDQLREMKVAETALRQEYDAIHTKFRAWKDQHSGELAKAENDPDVQKWRQEMDVFRSSIPGLAL